MKFIFKKILLIVFSIFMIPEIHSKNLTLFNSSPNNIEIKECAPIPAVPRDCFSYDNDNNSCCYFSFVERRGCVWLGQRYVGKTEYGALYFECGDSVMKFTISIFTIYIILIFF